MNEEILKQMAALVAETAEQLAPLIEAKQPHIGPLGTQLPRPTPQETAAELRLKANALRQLCGISRPTPQE